jgi:hypothetical protein
MMLPEPFVPPEVDLRGLPFMPLDTIRVLDSDLFALSTGDEFKAAFALWCKSWVQLPGGSLPDDDRILAYLSGAGPRWRKVKAMALRNWVKCSDGRLYHPVVAEKALEAWEDRVEYREVKGNAADRQKRHRAERKKLFDDLRAHGIIPKWDTPVPDLRAILERLDGQSENATDAFPETPPVTEPETPETRTATAKTGTVTGIETGKEEEPGLRPEAPVVAALPAIQPKRAVFGQCLQWLVVATGKPEGACRGILGRWCRDHGDQVVISAFEVASREPPAGDPVAWITSIIQKEKRNGTGSSNGRSGQIRPHEALFDAFAAALDLLGAAGGQGPER